MKFAGSWVWWVLVVVVMGVEWAGGQNTERNAPPLPEEKPRPNLGITNWTGLKTKYFYNTVLLPGYTSHYHPWHERISYPRKNKRTQAKWVVVGGRRIVPGSVYRMAVEALRIHEPLVVRAALLHSSEQVASAKAVLQPGQLSHILLKVPDSSVDGRWQLRVEGMEGVTWVFKRLVDLSFQAKFLTILIQPSRPVYNAAQTVRFRAILLTRELKPYDEPVDVYVLDPRGRKMRRWPSLQTGHGVMNLNFDLPDYPLVGNWTIRVQARSQIEDHTILVEHYFRPRFEVFVRLPHTVKTGEEFLHGYVVANMTNWRDVHGNCTLKLEYAHHDYPGHIPTTFETVYEQLVTEFIGSNHFILPLYTVWTAVGGMSRISSGIGGTSYVPPAGAPGVTVRVSATVEEAYEGHVQSGFAMARIVEEQAKITFIGDQPLIFRPGMPCTIHLFATYEDDHPLEEEELEGSKITVTLRASGGTSKTEDRVLGGESLLEGQGVVSVIFDVPDDSLALQVSASLVTGSGLTASATLIGSPQHSPRHRHIQIETSTPDASPGEFIVLHVRNNFYITHFNYVVLAEGVVVYTGREPVVGTPPTVTTFSLPASTEMAPAAHILVWVVTPDGQLVSHAIAVPINPIGNHEVGIRWNEHKDHSGGSVEMKMEGEAGAFFGVSAMWEETNHMDAGHELDVARILHHMMQLEYNDTAFAGVSNVTTPHIRRAATRSRDGNGARVSFFATSVAGPDAPTTFNFSNLIVLTDADLFYHPHHASDAPECSLGQVKCLTGGCYSKAARCDGEFQCSDHSDEAGCPVNIDPLRHFRLHRLNRLNRFYDSGDGDWAWLDVRGLGSEIQVFPIPKRPQTWVVSMFAVGKELGLGIMEDKIQFDSAGPFMLTLEGPKVARQWEQVGLRACIFNFHLTKVGVLVTLPESPNYRSVLVEENGYVTSYAPRTVSGEHQHIVWLGPGESLDVHIPIVFTRKGSIEVSVYGSTMMMMDMDTITIDVVPEGVSIGKHTSILLDLKNRALVYDFLDIDLDQSPIIPYSLKRRYIYDTPSGHISITGDVVGPAFPEIPVGAASLLGLEVMGAETAAFNFAANLWTLHYLRLTNQINPALTFKVLSAVNVQYAALARYQDDDGAFRMWPESEPSVWLSAYSIRTLWLATFQDWENMIYIDPNIINNATKWILQYQNHLGAFTETPNYTHPLDSKIYPTPSSMVEREGYKNVSLTAQVVLTLTQILPGLYGETRNNATIAKANAINYLERELDTLTDPYDVALVAWALTKSDSGKKEAAFSKLDKMKRILGNKIYWSREAISLNPIVHEDSQKPFIKPKDDQKWDAHSVETTAYALLVYVAREGIGIIQENIVRFLAMMRELDGGLISTLDSVATMEALVEYSYRARLRDVTDMRIVLEHSANPNFTINVNIDSTQNLAALRSFDIDQVWGHISVIGHGSGQALVQLDYSYGVDYITQIDYPPVESFHFTIKQNFHGRNNSLINITTCQSWHYLEEAPTSGVAIVEVHLPSGYYIMQDALIDLVNSRTVRNLRWALRTDTQVKFFFNHLDVEETCLSYQVERWHPVSNHSRYNMARVYDLYQPERFNMTIWEIYPLYDLDVCEVCGSYQCSYCPFYSKVPPSVIPSLPLLILLSAIITGFTRGLS